MSTGNIEKVRIFLEVILCQVIQNIVIHHVFIQMVDGMS